MQPGDLMMLGDSSVLYSQTEIDRDPFFGKLGDLVTIIAAANENGWVTILHPDYGVVDVIHLHLFPMTGGHQ